MTSASEPWIPAWLRGAWGAGLWASALWIGAWAAAALGGAPEAAAFLSEWSWPLLQGFALAACLRVATAPALEAPTRRAWGMLAASVALVLLADAIYAVLSLGGKDPGFPSAADPLYLASYPPALAALLMLPVQPTRRRGEAVRVGLDLAMVATATTVAVWDALIRPTAAAHAGDPVALLLSAGPIVGDLLQLAAVSIVLLRRPRPSTGAALLLLSTSLALSIGSNLTWVSQSLTDTYRSGALYDLGWLAGAALIGAAALRQHHGGAADVARMTAVLERVAVGLPIAATALGLALIVSRFTSHGTGSLATVVGAVTLCALVVLRQTWSGVQTAVLGRELEEANAWLAAERAKSERLLLDILPAEVAQQLKEGRRERPLAESFDEVSVLFADIVGFTPLAARTPPEELVALLDEIFSRFDALAGKHGLEKIKTIGDAYMVAGGVPVRSPDHVAATARMALEMRGALAALAAERGVALDVRIGMSCGPVVAGVIGARKFCYDLWGDTVNTASRMESHGLPGAVHVSAAVRDRLAGAFAFSSRGEIEIKGIGRRETFLLVGEAPGDA